MLWKLDSASRLSKLTPSLLSIQASPVLDGAVAKAARAADAPIGIVTLVASATQFFRAQSGMPKDLAVSRATSRSDSFCQFVVRSESAFVVTDAVKDSRVPKNIVKHYGLRAYAGVPVRIENEVVGSLCVLDTTQARDFTADAIADLSALANIVSTELRSEWLTGGPGDGTGLRLSLEAGALTRLHDAERRGELAPELVDRGRLILSDLEAALAEALLNSHPAVRSRIEASIAGYPTHMRSTLLARLMQMTDFVAHHDIERRESDVVNALAVLQSG